MIVVRVRGSGARSIRLTPAPHRGASRRGRRSSAVTRRGRLRRSARSESRLEVGLRSRDYRRSCDHFQQGCRRCPRLLPRHPGPVLGRCGGGWRIFALPPAELAAHPGHKDSHELYLMCDDVQETGADEGSRVHEGGQRRGVRPDDRAMASRWWRAGPLRANAPESARAEGLTATLGQRGHLSSSGSSSDTAESATVRCRFLTNTRRIP